MISCCKASFLKAARRLALIRNQCTDKKIEIRFDGKVVLITGASSGIGAEAAVHFASLGASLVITGRNEENLKKVSEKCKSFGGPCPVIVIADLTKESDVEKVINETMEKSKKLDVLVNNAGILAGGSILKTSLDQYDSVLRTNMRSVYHLTMLAAPHLIASKGNIVNVSSVAGAQVFPGALAYCVSKAALNHFTRCVAIELASKGVRVNSVNPGVIVTDIHQKAGMNESGFKKFMEKCKETHAIGRPGESIEVVAGIIFLASDAASFITAELLHIDGGRQAMGPQ